MEVQQDEGAVSTINQRVRVSGDHRHCSDGHTVEKRGAELEMSDVAVGYCSVVVVDFRPEPADPGFR